jgi:hypothetical protein
MSLRNRHLGAAVFLLTIGILFVDNVWAADPGNASPALASQPPSLNEKDFFPYKAKGRATLAGQAFLGSPSGKAITQAGVPIHLIPITPYTRHWFDHNVRTISCSSTEPSPPTEGTIAPRSLSDCAHGALAQLRTEKRLAPYLRMTRANPTGHFWFSKIPAGRYYIVSLIESGSGTHHDERLTGLTWLAIEIDVGEKLTNLVVTDCKSDLC